MTEDEINAALAQMLRSKGWQPVWCHNADGNVWALKDTTGPAPFGQEGQQPPGYTLSFRPPQSVKIFDVDHYDEKHGMDTINRAESQLGRLPYTWRVTSRGSENPSGRYLFRCPEDVEFNDAVFQPYGEQETRLVKGRETTKIWTDVEVVRTRHRWSWAPGVEHYKNGELIRVYNADDEECAMPAVDELPWLPDAWVEYLRNPPRSQSDNQFRPDPNTFGTGSDWYKGVEDSSLSSRGQLCDFAFWLMISSYNDQDLVIEELRRVSGESDPADPWLTRDFLGMTDANTQNKTAEYIAKRDEEMAYFKGLPDAPATQATPVMPAMPDATEVIDPRPASMLQPVTFDDTIPFDPYTLPPPAVVVNPEPEIAKPEFPVPAYYKVMPDAYRQEFARQAFNRQVKLDIEAGVRLQQGNEWRARNDGRGGFTNPWDAPPVPDPATFHVEGTGYLVTPNTVTILYGNRASGKTWVAATWARQEVTADNHVLWLDFERQASLMKTKLVALGMKEHQAARRFHYSGGGLPPVDYLCEMISMYLLSCARVLVVVDSFRDLLGAVVPAGDSNSGESVSKVYSEYLNFLHEAGATICLIDHAPKSNTDSTFGSERKESAADNVFKVEMKEKFVLNHSGYSMISCTKDRYGVVPVDLTGESAPVYLWVPGEDDVPKGTGRKMYPRYPEIRNYSPEPDVGLEDWEKPADISEAEVKDIRSYFSTPFAMATTTELARYLMGKDADRKPRSKGKGKLKPWEPGMKVWTGRRVTDFAPWATADFARSLPAKARDAGLVKDSAEYWSWPDALRPVPVLGTEDDASVLARLNGEDDRVPSVYEEQGIGDGQ